MTPVTIRKMFEYSVEIILDAEEDSPEFHLAFSVIQRYKMYILEKKMMSEKCDQETEKCKEEFLMSSRCC